MAPSPIALCGSQIRISDHEDNAHSLDWIGVRRPFRATLYPEQGVAENFRNLNDVVNLDQFPGLRAERPSVEVNGHKSVKTASQGAIVVIFVGVQVQTPPTAGSPRRGQTLYTPATSISARSWRLSMLRDLLRSTPIVAVAVLAARGEHRRCSGPP